MDRNENKLKMQFWDLEDYTLADAFLKQDDITLITKKDYIANPKKNGYRSLHLIISIPIFLA